MMKKITFTIILSLLGLSLISSHLFAATRGIKVIAKTGQSLYIYENYYALVVGVSNYEKWPRLPNAVNDAKEVASKLKELGFEVKLVLDPTSREMKTALSEMVYDMGIEENRALLFYYAGHGETETLADKTKMGYIIPKDCPILEKDPKGFANHAISMRDIESASMRIHSKHVLMLFDSCFSGSLFALVRAVPDDITEKSTLPVRQYITAGREDEQVPDKSMFKRCFLIGLGGDADLTGDGYITGSELGMYLSEKVVNYTHRRQHPQYGKINNPDLDRGDFIFALKTPSRLSALGSEAPPPSLEAGEQRLAEERARLERERRELEQLKALVEERKKLEAERKRLEGEKKKLEMAKLPPEPKYSPTVSKGKPPISPGRVTRGWLGVAIQQVTPEIKEKFGLETIEGALIGEVTEGSPSERGGLERGDVIISFDGKKIKEMSSLPPIVAGTPVGQTVEVIVIRKGSERGLTVKIGQLIEKTRAAAPTTPEFEDAFGFSAQGLTPELSESLSLKGEKGVVISRVRKSSPASEAGLQTDDLIQEIENEPVENMDDYKKIMGESASKKQIVMFISHRGHTRYVVISKHWVSKNPAPYPASKKQQQPCFIAAAAFWPPFDPNVNVLHKFHEHFLLVNSLGRTFVETYYAYSPSIARFIAKHDSLRAIVHLGLLPLAGVGWTLLNLGLVTILASIILFSTGLIGLGGSRKRFKRN